MRKILIFVFLFSFYLICPFSVWAADSVAYDSAKIQRLTADPDCRKIKLKLFLKSQNSPMAFLAGFLVETAEKYGLDYRLIPAISGVESSFGRAIPVNSYNAYGWNNGNYYFKSWEDGVEVVARALKENYLDRGRKTVYQIAPIYCPPSSTWAGKVLSFMEEINNLTALQICP